MLLKLEEKEKIRDTCYSKQVLVLQTLLHEEVITKNTYDTLHTLLIEMDKNNPVYADFIETLFSTCEKTQEVSNSSTELRNVWTRLINLNGKQYHLQFKEVK